MSGYNFLRGDGNMPNNDRDNHNNPNQWEAGENESYYNQGAAGYPHDDQYPHAPPDPRYYEGSKPVVAPEPISMRRAPSPAFRPKNDQRQGSSSQLPYPKIEIHVNAPSEDAGDRSRETKVNRGKTKKREEQVDDLYDDSFEQPDYQDYITRGRSMATTIISEDERNLSSKQRFEKKLWSKLPEQVTTAFDHGKQPRPPLSSNNSSGYLGDKVYHYAPLEWNEYRLLRILPARMTTLKCEVIHVSTQERPPKYIAISYAWGDVGDTKKIQVEGTSVSITSSLYGAMDALREKGSDIYVWADALCIDQQNNEERTQQVQMMTNIYRKAESVAVWLGPEGDESSKAMELLELVASKSGKGAKTDAEFIPRLIASSKKRSDFVAVVALFEREYWKRLWVVQEVVNAQRITVFCGKNKLPWKTITQAADTFRQYRKEIDHYFPSGSLEGQPQAVSQNRMSYSQVLALQGPSSFANLGSGIEDGEGTLLQTLRICRRKLSADARDKVFGLLGVLASDDRREFPADYSLSVKEVYTNVVDYLLATTERLDVICEAIYFPLHNSPINLPSWVPDWSHIPHTTSLGLSYDFDASGDTKAEFNFLDERRNKLEISGIYIDRIQSHGVAVGTLCALADFLMAFLHWRALLLGSHDTGDSNDRRSIQQEFCRTLCLGQAPPKWNKPDKWLAVCYHLFASLIADRLPYLPLDRELQAYADADVGINPNARRRILQEHVGGRMMGRSFCLTDDGRLGMGTGFMAPGDVVIVPLGCYTPILLRPEGNNGEFRLVGDVYISGYMHGRAIEQLRKKERKVEQFVIH